MVGAIQLCLGKSAEEGWALLIFGASLGLII